MKILIIIIMSVEQLEFSNVIVDFSNFNINNAKSIDVESNDVKSINIKTNDNKYIDVKSINVKSNDDESSDVKYIDVKTNDVKFNDNKSNDIKTSNVKTSDVKTSDVKTNSKSKKNLTAYWGIKLSTDLFDNDIIKEKLTLQPQLVMRNELHSTLLYVGKKPDIFNENIFKPLENVICTLIINCIGLTSDAMALGVKSIKYESINLDGQIDLIDMPTFADKQHITIALKPGIAAKDSVLTLNNDSTYEMLIEPLIVKGKVTRYLF